MEAQNIDIFFPCEYVWTPKKERVEVNKIEPTFSYSGVTFSSPFKRVYYIRQLIERKDIVIEEAKKNIPTRLNEIKAPDNFLTDKQIENFALISNSLSVEIKHAEKAGLKLTPRIFNTFYLLRGLINDLPIEKCGIELMNDKVKITITLPEQKMIMISKPTNPGGKGYEPDEIMTSFFINKRMINSNVSKIKTFRKRFDEFILETQ